MLVCSLFVLHNIALYQTIQRGGVVLVVVLVYVIEKQREGRKKEKKEKNQKKE